MAQGIPTQQRALEQFLEDCDYGAVPDPSSEEVRVSAGLVSDSKDIPIALAAIDAGGDYLVTNAKDLTAQDETTAALREKFVPSSWVEFSERSWAGRVNSWRGSGDGTGVICHLHSLY